MVREVNIQPFTVKFQLDASNCTLLHYFSNWQQDQIEVTRTKKRRYIETCFKQILQQKGVLNAFVFDENGVPRKTTIERMETIRHIGLIQEIIIKSKRALQTFDQHNDIQSLRVRTRKFEILVSKDNDFYFVVYQNAPGTFHMLMNKLINLLYIVESESYSITDLHG